MKHNDWWLDKACYSWYRLVPLIVLHFKHRKFEDTKHCGNIRLSSAEMILLVKHFLPMKIKKNSYLYLLLYALEFRDQCYVFNKHHPDASQREIRILHLRTG